LKGMRSVKVWKVISKMENVFLKIRPKYPTVKELLEDWLMRSLLGKQVHQSVNEESEIMENIGIIENVKICRLKGLEFRIFRGN
jgi:hypothetical protein